jgi:hypothetical protein
MEKNMNVSECFNFRRQNQIKKETDKIINYTDFTIGIQRVWNVKTEVIPVIIGASGTVST